MQTPQSLIPAMPKVPVSRILQSLIWIVNGLWAKVFQKVPRHRAIVARILGPKYAPGVTRFIGFGEIALGLWVSTGLRKQQTAWLQIGLIATMNLLEAVFARDLLLWGGWNALFAGILIGCIWWDAFGRNR